MGSLQTALDIVERLVAAGFDAYLAGGSVRDMLLGRTPVDYDIATAARPDQVLALFPHTIDVGAAFGVIRVLERDGEYEVATFRTEGAYVDGRHPSSTRFATAREDVMRRDFTINGLLYDPRANRVLDFAGGRADLDARVIRTIGDPTARFTEDRLRMLRAVRLATELGFEIATEAMAALRRLAPQVEAVSPERIRDEVVRIVAGPDPSRALELLRETGLLQVILPEVAAEIGVPQPEAFHPEGDVFEHTRLAMAHLKAPSLTLAMATLLHDIGKPPTFERAHDRIRFSRHDEVGAALARTIMERLRFSRREADRVVALVGRHMVFKDVPQMRESKLRRLIASEEFPELLALHRADCAASHGDLRACARVEALVEQLAGAPPVPPPLINGQDVLALGLAPGPRVGEILRRVENARLDGEIQTREEALALASALARSSQVTQVRTPAPRRERAGHTVPKGRRRGD